MSKNFLKADNREIGQQLEGSLEPPLWTTTNLADFRALGKVPFKNEKLTRMVRGDRIDGNIKL